jgi:outer membrane protein assembly factor BamB/Icc-related predicted phosphoesterase
MKKFFVLLLTVFLLTQVNAQFKPFRFAFISDTHIGSPNGAAEEDLRRTVTDINQMNDVVFVVVTGDVTELGTDEEIRLAKQILDSLKIPYYVMPGNHDTGWSESGGVSFTRIFGYDKFSFEHNGIRFLGCPSGPYVRMSDGHIPREAVVWLDKELKKIPAKQPVIFLNHYPLDNSLDNWYEVTDRLKKKNVMLALCGHGHANSKRNWEGIPGVMGRSNLRAKAPTGGYNLVDVKTDTITFSEKTTLQPKLKTWHKVAVKKHVYDTVKLVRPDFSINKNHPFVQAKWVFSSDANVISTPVVFKNMVAVGNSKGEVEAININSGKKIWKFSTKGAIYSSPATYNDNIIFGSGDGNVYCLNQKGKQVWKLSTPAAVLGSPIIENGIVYIGGSAHNFIAIDAKTGKEKWSYRNLKGPVVSKPLISGDNIIFGAWDTYLYCLNKTDGTLKWQWNNGSTVPNFSPASCIPVAYNGVVYIVAPDRYITALDEATGAVLWRNNDAMVRESIGISKDGQYVYAKTMNDEVVAYETSRDKQSVAWKINCKYGYDHVPSMLIEEGSNVFFGTKNGVVYSIDKKTKDVAWGYKIDNSMVNTVNVLGADRLIASTMDGKVALIVNQRER